MGRRLAGKLRALCGDGKQNQTFPLDVGSRESPSPRPTDYLPNLVAQSHRIAKVDVAESVSAFQPISQAWWWYGKKQERTVHTYSRSK